MSDVESLLRCKLEDVTAVPPYASAEECYLQMSLLLHFLEIKLEMDRARLTYFGGALQKTLTELPSIATGDAWTRQLHRLSKATIDALESATNDTGNIDQSESILSLLLFLSTLKPKYTARNLERYYSVLGGLFVHYEKYSRRLWEQLEEAVLAPLIPTSADAMAAYIAFGTELLTSPETLTRMDAGRLIAPKLDFMMLTAALNRVLEEDHETKMRVLGHKDRSLWLLAHLVFLHSQSPGVTGSFPVSQETGYIKILSALLVAQRSEISSRIDILDQHMVDTAKRADDQSEDLTSAPLPPFIREQILKLSQKTSVVSILTQVGLANSYDRGRGSESAQVLATYALTLTRVFPGERADKIRMWLCAGSVNLNQSTGVSAILFFWRYCRSSGIFQKISKDHYNAVPLVRLFLGLEGSMTTQTLQSTQQEWKMLLLFLELYTYAIVNMDDERFFVSGELGSADSNVSSGTSRDRSLPLRELRDLVTFLKNLAFALYWNSKDLQEDDTSEQSAGLGAYFGTAASNPARRLSARPGALFEESARIQLRDLVTRLLRSIHQRE